MANTLYIAVYTAAAAATWARADLANGRNGWSATGYVADAVDASIRTNDGDETGGPITGLSAGTAYKLWAIVDDGSASSNGGAPQASAEFTTLAVATADQTATYAVRIAATVDAAATYIVRASVAVDQAAAYQVRAAAAVDQSASYSVRAAATADQAAAYDVRAAATADQAATYVVRAAAIADQVADYSVHQAATVDQGATYVLRASATVDQIADYEVQEGLTVDQVADYSVHQSATVDQGAAYPVLQAATADQGADYSVRYSATVDFSVGYSVLAAAFNDQTATYSVRGGYVVDHTGAYVVQGVLSSVYETFEATCRVTKVFERVASIGSKVAPMTCLIFTGKIYVGDYGTEIILDTEVDLGDATSVAIRARKPDGAHRVWVAAVYQTTKVRYITQQGDLSVVGTWRVHPFVVTPAGEWQGNNVSMEVSRKWR